MLTHLFCPRCGLRQPIGTPRCPNCSEKLPLLSGEKAQPPPYPPPQPEKLFWSRKRVWRFQTALLASAGITVALFDFLDGFTVEWSQKPLLSILFAWVCNTLFIRKRTRPVKALPGIFIALTLFLLLLDAADGSLTWALSTGLPIAATSVGLAYPLLKKWPPPSGKRAQFLGGVITSATVEALIIDLLTGKKLLSWSIIVVAASIPLILFLLLYHRERSRWERFLRI